MNHLGSFSEPTLSHTMATIPSRSSGLGEILSSIDLKDLHSPHELSQFILQFPSYKKYFTNTTPNNTRSNNTPSNTKPKHTRNDSGAVNDLIICNKLSQFVYQEKLNGAFFVNNHNFSKLDFQNMINQISSDNNEDFEWIYHILHIAIKNSNSNTTKIAHNNHSHIQMNSKSDINTYIDNVNDHHKLPWIASKWGKYQLLMDEIVCSSDDKTCGVVNKCKSLRRVIMALHFHQSVIMQMETKEDENAYLDRYVHIYDDYKHVIAKHLIFVATAQSQKNLEIIRNKVAFYVECDVNNCQVYQRRHDKEMKRYLQMMEENEIIGDGNIDGDGDKGKLFCGQLLNLLHCYFVHGNKIESKTKSKLKSKSKSRNKGKTTDKKVKIDKDKICCRVDIKQYGSAPRFGQRHNRKRSTGNVFACFACL